MKGLWDADRHEGLPLHVVVLGSAPLLMQRGLSESMLGRFETIRLPHWSFAEMSEAFGFDLDHYIYFGGYPGAASLIREQRRWREYILGSIIEPNIERDILAMERVDKPALLKRLFEFGAEISGQILAYDKMLGQIQDAGNTTTLARYLDLLSKAGLLTGLWQIRRGGVPPQGLQSQTQRAQHRAHVGSFRLHVRRGESGSKFLGTIGRKRRWCTPVQYGNAGGAASLLAGTIP